MKRFLPAGQLLSLITALQFAIAPARAHPVADDMAAAANKFLASLDAGQKAKAQFDFKADDRLDWHYIPKDRKGLTIREMSADQRKLVHALLLTGYSQHGYAKATNVMSLEPVLHELEGAARTVPRDQGLYHVFIFGTPEGKGT